MIAAPRSRPQRPRSIVLALLACALALRLLIPAGWMPVVDASGIHLVLCSGSGPIEMPSAHANPGMKGMHHHRHPDQAMPDHPCAFSGLGVALAEPLLPILAMPALILSDRLDHAAETVAVGRGLAAPPPPSTGPPAIR